MAVRSQHESRERNKQSDFGLVTDSGLWMGRMAGNLCSQYICVSCVNVMQG